MVDTGKSDVDTKGSQAVVPSPTGTLTPDSHVTPVATPSPTSEVTAAGVIPTPATIAAPEAILTQTPPSTIPPTATINAPRAATLVSNSELLSRPWVQATQSPAGPTGGSPIHSVALSSDKITIFATTLRGTWLVTERGTGDNSNWDLVVPRSGAGPNSAFAFDPINPSIIYGLGDRKFWRSEDGGDSWVSLGPSLGDRIVARPDVVYSGRFKSTDGGQNWRETNQDYQFLFGSPGDSSTLYYYHNVGGLEAITELLITTDGGINWSEVTAPVEAKGAVVKQIASSDPPIIVLGYKDEGLFISDALDPASWTGIPWPPGASGEKLVAFHPSNPDVLAVTVDSGEVFLTSDGGSSWVPLHQAGHEIENVIYQDLPAFTGGRRRLVLSGGNNPQICVGSDIGLWCHSTELEPVATPVPTPEPIPTPTTTLTPCPANLCVTKTADTNDGTCDIDCSLREAIAVAVSGNRINVPAGTYTLNLGSELIIDKSLTLQGSGSTKTIIQAATSEGVANTRVFTVSGNDIVISGVTIRHGRANVQGGGGPPKSGGGVYDVSESFTLLDSIVTSNTAIHQGGGIYSGGGALTVSGTTVAENTSNNSGGGIFKGGGSLELAASDVSGNSAIAGNGGNGGDGGGIYSAGILTMTGSRLSGNHSKGDGGAIRKAGGKASLSQSVIDGNMANGAGGGVNTGSSDVTMTNVTISNNSSNLHGGGIINGGKLTLTNVTLVGNSAAYTGGGINNFGGIANLRNTIIVANGIGGDCAESLTSFGHNLSSDGTCNLTETTDLPSTDPLLGPLQDNGGSTLTHALLNGSPAIDAGDNALCPATDQRGVSRSQDGACDIGAYER